jgi:hypothetical protein
MAEGKNTNAKRTVKVAKKNVVNEETDNVNVVDVQNEMNQVDTSDETDVNVVTKKVVKKSKQVEKKTDKKVEENQEDDCEDELVEGVSNLKFEAQHDVLQSEVQIMREKLRDFANTMKKLEAAYKHDVKRVSKAKRKRNANAKPTGFIKKTAVSDKLAKFLHIESGTLLSGPEITKRVWAELKSRNLQYKEDKRVLRTNKEVSEIFNIPSSVNKSTSHKDKDGFNFCNIQKYISNALVN